MPRPEEIEARCQGLRSGDARVKYGAAKALRLLSKQAPELLYSRFDLFFGLFEGDNTFLRWGSTRILGNLAAVDRADRLEQAFHRFFAPIRGHDLIGAANVIAAGAQIALAKPHLADRIAGEILKVERASYRTPECRNVAIGHAISSLDRFYLHLTQKKRVIGFLEEQLLNPRQATRRKAGSFSSTGRNHRCGGVKG